MKGENLDAFPYALFIWFLTENTLFVVITIFEKFMDLRKLQVV